mgnify:FL=1
MSHRIASLLLLAIGAIYVGLATQIQPTPFSDPLGPRWVPVFFGVFLMSTAVAMFAQPRTPVAWPPPGTLVRLALTLVGFVAYGLLLNPLGFVVATAFAFTLFALQFGGTPRNAALAGVIFAVAAYLLFSTALDLYLPTGAWLEGWL